MQIIMKTKMNLAGFTKSRLPRKTKKAIKKGKNIGTWSFIESMFRTLNFGIRVNYKLNTFFPL